MAKELFIDLPSLKEQECIREKERKRLADLNQIIFFKKCIREESICPTYGDISMNRDYQGIIKIRCEGFSQNYLWRLWRDGDNLGSRGEKIPRWYMATLLPQKDQESEPLETEKIEKYVHQEETWTLIKTALFETIGHHLSLSSNPKITMVEKI